MSFLVDFDGERSDKNVGELVEELVRAGSEVNFLGSKNVPWFPKSAYECDALARNIIDAGDGPLVLQEDHPGFSDPEYRDRRAEIAELAKRWEYGDPLPVVDYTQAEIDCWRTIYSKLYPLQQKYACAEHLECWTAMMDHCGISENAPPQVRDVSAFLNAKTDFRLRPVAGLLSARDFFHGLAFRIFFCTQYLRHHSQPLYTPEPDVVHEIMGHAPLFANPEFADFSQEIGLASIGATDEQIAEIARLYWYTVEFGLVKGPNGERKIMGAGILSSFGEIEYSQTDVPEIRPFDPAVASQEDYPVTVVQPVYYIADSFSKMKDQFTDYVDTFDKPFHPLYDSITGKIVPDRNVTREHFDIEAYLAKQKEYLKDKE